MKACNRCRKSGVEFHLVNRQSHGKGPIYKYEMPTCKPCIREIDRTRSHAVMADPVRHAARKAGMKRRQFRAVYGLPLEYKLDLLKTQENRCAICKRSGLELVTDHNHTTGQVRKLLCRACNCMIGYCQEDPEILRNGIAYLQEHNPSTNTRRAA